MDQSPPPQFFRRLMPSASEKELNQAKDRFDPYADLLCRIAIRIASDPEARSALAKAMDDTAEAPSPNS